PSRAARGAGLERQDLAPHGRRPCSVGEPRRGGADPGAGGRRADDRGDGDRQYRLGRRAADGGPRAGPLTGGRMALSPAADETILSVGELTRRLKESIEIEFPALWVRGEVSGLKRPDSGHLYFALKEGRIAVLDCVLWRTNAVRLSFEPRDATDVEVFG